MPAIKNIQQKYFSKISPSDLEILISHAIKKPKEFILAHPEYKLSPNQELRIKNYAKRRIKREPIAYITKHKEFYGLDFKVNKNVLIPRPETEALPELAISNLPAYLPCRQADRTGRQLVVWKNKKIVIADIGTGSGNIIISVAKNLDSLPRRPASPNRGEQAGRLRGNDNIKFYASDISKKALQLACQNAKKHKVDKKIKFLQGNLLKPLMDKKILFIDHCSLIIVANLPYLSKKIYDSAPADIKKYEPKSALYSSEEGLKHYKKLFQQIKSLVTNYQLPVTVFLEFSPEQKNKLAKLIRNYFPQSKTIFHKDLAGKWRVCVINITLEKRAFV
ncbi:peptide chain release factor N(5)-glutamine methyltransferase [bacterium]|nr:peptide chain release factor N(5)-glutamine methyltransferase [bacterium]